MVKLLSPDAHNNAVDFVFLSVHLLCFLLSNLLMFWPHVRTGAQDGASPNFMGLVNVGLDISIFGDFLYSVLLLSAIVGLDFLGLALSRPQVRTAVKFLGLAEEPLPDHWQKELGRDVLRVGGALAAAAIVARFAIVHCPNGRSKGGWVAERGVEL